MREWHGRVIASLTYCPIMRNHPKEYVPVIMPGLADSSLNCPSSRTAGSGSKARCRSEYHTAVGRQSSCGRTARVSFAITSEIGLEKDERGRGCVGSTSSDDAVS